MQKVTETSGVYAVIAPNMGKQIVALQAALTQMAADFPGAFEGYKLAVTESHQSTKADTSGTAKAVSDQLAILSAESTSWNYDQIARVRDPAEQVPEGALQGHAFHTYSLVSKDGHIEFQIRHNVAGRSMYAEGALDAVAFLAPKILAGAEKRVYTMMDVLRAGAM